MPSQGCTFNNVGDDFDWRNERRSGCEEQLGNDVPEWRRRPGSHVPEWRRRPQRPLLQKDGIDFVQWLLHREVKARRMGFPDLDLKTAVKDGACQTEIQQNPCAICLSAARTHACAPCGHFCLCEYCARKQGRRGDHMCPLCRQPALRVFRIILGMAGEAGSNPDTFAMQQQVVPVFIPEWRREAMQELALKSRRQRQQRRHLQCEALEELQGLLFENTVKTVKPQRSRETNDFECQVDDASEMCVMCRLKPPAFAALPCSHLCVCADCASGLPDHCPCPACNTESEGFLRIFM